MFCRYLFLLLRIPLFSAVSSAAVALGATTGQVLYPIDAGVRGTEVVNAFGFYPTPTSGSTLPYFVMQTTIPHSPTYTTYRYLSNGIIPCVQSLTQTPYNTLLIVTYLIPSLSALQAVPQYIVVPAEQILTLSYFLVGYGPTPNIQTPFTSTTIPGTTPFFSVDPTQRAIDIVSAVTTLMKKPFKNASTNSQVYVQTTLNGPYNPSLPKAGLLQNITAVSYSGSLIQFTFQTGPTSPSQTILVAPEQVQQIIYVRVYGNPSA